MNKISLNDNGVQFDAILLEASKASGVVLFAVGSGGNPERHLPLLNLCVLRGYTVVAPYFERIASTIPTQDELYLRARRLRLALDFATQPNFSVIGAGHSIGATVLLALAGGQVWLGPEQQLSIKLDERLTKLVLMTPAIGFFQAPGALDQIDVPLLVYAGTSDVITPPLQSEFLKDKLGERVSVDLRLVEGAGHFSFMNTLPPQTTDPMPNREALLAKLSSEIGEWIVSGGAN